MGYRFRKLVTPSAVSGRMFWSIVVLFLIVVVSVPLSLSQGGSGDDAIILVHAIFRHGNKTPDKWSTYPNDIHKNVTYEPFGRGQLTKKGKQTMYELGKLMRTKYGKFLGSRYKDGEVIAKTTNFKRTKMSLQLVLAALYPPSEEDSFDPNVHWQPIPYVYETGHNEIADPSYFCLSYVQEYYNYIFTPEGQQIIKKHTGLYETLHNYAGGSYYIPKHVYSLFETLKTQEDFGLPLPAWSKQIYPDSMLEAGYDFFDMLTANNKLRRLSGGFLLDKIIKDTREKLSTKSTPVKIYLYSVHDINIIAMLKVLKVHYRHLPTYGAAILIEVHKTGEGYGVKILYKGTPSSTLYTLKIPGCGNLCEWSKFQEIMKSSLPTENDSCLNMNEI